MLRQTLAARTRRRERTKRKYMPTCLRSVFRYFSTTHTLIRNNNPQLRMHKCTAGDDADDDDGCACKFSVCENKCDKIKIHNREQGRRVAYMFAIATSLLFTKPSTLD